jgi:hypothetical protein
MGLGGRRLVGARRHLPDCVSSRRPPPLAGGAQGRGHGQVEHSEAMARPAVFGQRLNGPPSPAGATERPPRCTRRGRQRMGRPPSLGPVPDRPRRIILAPDPVFLAMGYVHGMPPRRVGVGKGVHSGSAGEGRGRRSISSPWDVRKQETRCIQHYLTAVMSSPAEVRL